MKPLKLRNVVLVATLIVLAVCFLAQHQTTLAQQTKQDQPGEEVVGSGDTAIQPRTQEMKVNVSDVKVKKLNGLSSFFTRISPDAAPGRNTLTINNLPAGTRVISVWMTEWASGNRPHAGAAFFYTKSVQLYNNGTQCRVVFDLEWNRHLPAACQVIFGPG